MKHNHESLLKRSRIRLLLSALVSVVALCLCGCAKDAKAGAAESDIAFATAVPKTAAAILDAAATPDPAATVSENTAADEEPLEFVRRRDGDPGGERISMIPLPEIPYVRPDMEGLVADMDVLIAQTSADADVQAIVRAYKDILERMTDVRTMYSLAEFRSCLNVTDDYYNGEMDYLSAQSVIVDHKHNELLCAFADSPLRTKLENAYFGRRYFDYNEKKQNETFLDLARQEEELLDQYRNLTAMPTVTYSGETKSLNEWMESESEEVRDGAEAAYIQAYREPVGRLFLELVKVRRQMALSRGYENYLSYAFKDMYYRDYTPARADEFFERVQIHLVPLLKVLSDRNPDPLPASLREDPLGHLASAAEEMGGIIWEAYRFMEAYDLCDVTASPTKRLEGYTDYLRAYEAPLIFLNPAISVHSLGTPHEFGHFVDAYSNYGPKGPQEISEAISTAMEYLAIVYDSSLNQEERAATLRSVLISKVLHNIGEQCAYADFEARVYAKNPEELTPEDLDEMYEQCRLAYGLGNSLERGYWITVRHFFVFPEYVLAYPLATVISLQIIRLEANRPGAGLDAFCRLMNRSPWAGVDIVVKNAKLQSPFSGDTLEQLAVFLREVLELS